MPNREYVIKCLKYLHDRETWKEGPLVFDDHAADRRRITADALALLREQEPVKPNPTGIEPNYNCGACRMPITQGYPFCPWCGKAVKWDDMGQDG